MKKLFTLVALLACFLGANAVEMTDFTVDYTSVGKSTVGWKADMIQDDWITADEDGLHLFNPAVTENFYDYQLWIFNGANLEVGVDYTVKIVAKVSDGSADVRCRIGDWNGGIASTVTVNSTEYQEYTYSGAATTASNGLLVQFGDYVGTVSFKSVTITHEGKQEKPVEWVEMLSNGNAETAWPDWATEGNPNETWKGDRTPEICAWGKTKGRNQGPNFAGDGEGFNPFPADIEVDPTDATNHVFVVHGAAADTEGDASAWDNQFWIQAPRAFKEGEEFMVSFRYRASAEVSSTDTQIHHKNPSNYLIWHAIGNIAFTTEWQTFNDKMTIAADMTGEDPGWSIAFNLNSVVKDPVDFYFDDISFQEMKLEHGLFVAYANTATGVEYDYDAAIKFEVDPDDAEVVIATVGKEGKKDSWVNEVMISTVSGNGKAFRANTIKPSGTITGKDAENWQDYVAGSNAKIALPAAGVWKISIAPTEADPSIGQILFWEVEGDDPVAKEPVAIVTNPTESVVNGTERDWKPAKDDGTPQDGEEGIGTGQPWDNQFWIAANRDLETDEVTVIKFQYKASKAARTSTQVHKVGDDGKPCTYLNWQAIGDVNFTEEWQDFSTEFKVPAGDNGMRSIVFNMAEIKEACDYYIKNVQWYIKDATLEAEGKTMENLINETGAQNFWIKVNKGAPETGIANVTAKTVKTSAVLYNIAGQRVNKNYKGLVVKDGKKVVLK